MRFRVNGVRCRCAADPGEKGVVVLRIHSGGGPVRGRAADPNQRKEVVREEG